MRGLIGIDWRFEIFESSEPLLSSIMSSPILVFHFIIGWLNITRSITFCFVPGTYIIYGIILHFLPQLSDFVPLEKGFYGFRAQMG